MTDDTYRKWMQISGAEVPGFNVRTQCDDAIGKLFALRNHLVDPVPEALCGLLDDLDAILDRVVEVGLDPDSNMLAGGINRMYYPDQLPEAVRRYAGGQLAASASGVFGECSCGGVFLEEITGPVSHADD